MPVVRPGFLYAFGGVILFLGLRAMLTLLRKPGIPDTPENREWLARVMMTEQAFGGKEPDYREWAGIAYIAINRSKRTNKSIRQVVHASDWFGADPPARMTSGSLLRTGNGPLAWAFANAIFDGKVWNPVGPRWHFIHIAPFDPCSEPGAHLSDKFVCADTGPRYGTRKIPRWSVARSQPGGRADYLPVNVGTARFS